MEDKVQAAKDLASKAREEGFDIPDELLEEVAGGLGSGEAVLLFRKMARAKKAGKSMDDLINELRKADTTDKDALGSEHLKEVETFIQRFW